MKKIYCIPRPQKLEEKHEYFTMSCKSVILQDSLEINFSAERLQAICVEVCGQKLPRSLKTKPPYSPAFTFKKSASLQDNQSYILDISKNGVELAYGGTAGALYGVSTIKQLLLQFGGILPCLHIEDQPDYSKRGVLYDISRDRMPNMETLYKFIDFMADVKLNQLFLYVEGLKFAYASYPEVWEGGSPLTGEEVILLDKYCIERCIELVPTQNCLGHMTKWLELEQFKPLAECEEGYPASWAPSGIEKPGTLAPYQEETKKLVENMTDYFLPYFSSEHYNVCLDEPYELGLGKSQKQCKEIGKDGIYMEYVLRLQQLAKKYGKSLMLWGDVIKKYPNLITEFPKDITLLEWGYDPTSPFEKYCAEYQKAGLDYYVCPGTACWLSLIGRIEKMKKNQENAAVNGMKYGASGYIVTSWGDRGHWEHFPIAFPGYLYGAALSWGVADNLDVDLSKGLDLLLFKDAAGVAGNVLLELGSLPDPLEGQNASLVAGIFKEDAKETDSIKSILDFDFDGLCEQVNLLISKLSKSRMQGLDAQIWKREIANNALLFCHGCHLGKLKQTLHKGDSLAALGMTELLIREMEELIGTYSQVWLLRNRFDGLTDSTETMQRLLLQYKELTFELKCADDNISASTKQSAKE